MARKKKFQMPTAFSIILILLIWKVIEKQGKARKKYLIIFMVLNQSNSVSSDCQRR